VLPPKPMASMLHEVAGRININAEILDVYLSTILPGFTEEEDDGQYGSSAMYDVLLLQVRACA
jgi:chorismate mutase